MFGRDSLETTLLRHNASGVLPPRGRDGQWSLVSISGQAKGRVVAMLLVYTTCQAHARCSI